MSYMSVPSFAMTLQSAFHETAIKLQQSNPQFCEAETNTRKVQEAHQK